MKRFAERALSYPIVIGIVIGMLVAGLVDRITEDTPAQSGATAASVGAGDGSDGLSPTSPTEGGAGAGAGAVDGAAPGSSSAAQQASTPGGATATGSPGVGGVALTASDVGVTATTIKVGIALEDSGTLAVFAGTGAATNGPSTVDGQRKTWQALIDDVNKNGGVLGRKIVPSFIKIDTTRGSDQRPACTTWTETEKVFAVFAMGAMTSFGGAGDLCLAVEHRTLTIEDTPQTPGDYYRQAGGLLVNTNANATRGMADAAYAFEHYGKLKGHKLGLIVDQDPGESMAKQGLVPALQRMGYKLAYTGVVSTDPSQGPAQATSHVAQMRAAGVDAVIDLTSFVNMTAFVSAADRQGWKPQYLVNNYDGNDFAIFHTGMPASWDGATVISYMSQAISATRPEEPVTKACRERINRISGSRYAAGQLSAAEQRVVIGPCTNMDLFVTAARTAGAALTRGKVSGAVQSRTFPVQMRGLGGSWGPGKTDFDDTVRALVWGPNDGKSDNCTPNEQRCWNDAGDPWNPRTQFP
jgi:ABC-type branched-subunit amino acid transport system substrate-binding protein